MNTKISPTSPTDVDVLIIGGGSAGLSAALALSRQRHSVIIFDSQRYRHDPAFEFNVLSTWEHKTPREWLSAARDELQQYDTVCLKTVEVVSLAKDEALRVFESKDARGQVNRGKKLILASGVEDILPDITGYETCWGKGIFESQNALLKPLLTAGAPISGGTSNESFHCLFCHGYEQSRKTTASAGVLAVQTLAMPRFALHMAHMAAQLVSPRKVTIYTDGNDALAQEILANSGAAQPMWTTDTRVIRALKPQPMAAGSESAAVEISFEDGGSMTHDFLAHSPLSAPRGPWAEQLGLALTPSGDYQVVGPFFETSVKGVYAAGDCMTPFKVAANAIANGSTAGAGVAVRLQEEKYGLEPIF